MVNSTTSATLLNREAAMKNDTAEASTTEAHTTEARKTEVWDLARFVTGAEFDSLSAQALEQLKIRVLDTLGVAIGALDAEPLVAIRALTDRLGGNNDATLIGGGTSAPDRAAFYNTALSRYLDFMDSYLAPGETNHPSDNMGAVMAAAERSGACGRDFLTALAVAYQVPTRLADEAPVRSKGFDHTTQGAYAVAAGVAKALGLTTAQTANALAIAGTANNALRVTRTGSLSHWKGLAAPQVGKEGTHAALLAEAGITGPAEVFEGNKGFKDAIAGEFHIDWDDENLESVLRTIVKKHNAEIHSQSAIDAALDIREMDGFDPASVRRIEITTFQVAYDIIGGGEEGQKIYVTTKEEADHSLPYMVAVALLDGEVTPDQYAPARITSDDVRALLDSTTAIPDDSFSARFPAEMPARVVVVLDDGTELAASRSAYKGFHTDPLDWKGARAKFDRLTSRFIDADTQTALADIIAALDQHQVADLTRLLADIGTAHTPQIDA